MKDSSSPARVTYDPTPATHGDLDIWGGRLIEMIDETKTELKAEIKEFRDEVNTRMGNFEDKQNNILLTVKAIEKKLSEK